MELSAPRNIVFIIAVVLALISLLPVIGISLGILAGLTLVARDRSRLWLGAADR